MAVLDPAFPCPLPARADDDAEALQAYRAAPGDERLFTKARRSLRELNDWRSMAKLLMEHAAAIGVEPDKLAKVAELRNSSIRVVRRAGPRARGRRSRPGPGAVGPTRERPRLRAPLRQLPRARLGARAGPAARWRMSWARKAQPSLLAGLHFAYAELQRKQVLRGRRGRRTLRAGARPRSDAGRRQRSADRPPPARGRVAARGPADGGRARRSSRPTPATPRIPDVAARISELHLRLARIAFGPAPRSRRARRATCRPRSRRPRTTSRPCARSARCTSARARPATRAWPRPRASSSRPRSWPARPATRPGAQAAAPHA